MDIIVKLVKFGEVNTYSLPQGSTVRDLMNMANETFVQGNVTIRHNTVTESSRLTDGDKVYLGRTLKGNQSDVFDVEFFKIGGGRAIHLGIEDGMTIKDAIEMMREEDSATFFKANGDPAYEFRIGGVQSSLTSEIPRPANESETLRIFCSQKMKGNE